MKKRMRLKPFEAITLGFKVKEYNRYQLNEQQQEEITTLRSKGVILSCESKDVDPTTVKHLWKKDKESSVFVKNPLYIEPDIKQQEEELQKLHEQFIKDAKQYAFKYPKFKRSKLTDPHCLLFDPADIHIGKICSSFEAGEEYNSQIAVKRVLGGLDGILNSSKGYNIDKIIFVAGNDVLHVDNAKRTTTSGTAQDTDGMWYDAYNMAKQLLIDIIEKLLTIADVEVVYNPSNHDYTHGFMLLDSISSWFHNCKQVTFNNNMSHRKYTVYGNNLIGTTHMDGAKADKMHSLMSEEASEHWHKCNHRYFYGHHVHHTTAKDIFSVLVETFRSPSGTDSWHHRNGYQHSPKAVEACIHHPLNGRVAKLTHIF